MVVGRYDLPLSNHVHVSIVSRERKLRLLLHSKGCFVWIETPLGRRFRSGRLAPMMINPALDKTVPRVLMMM
jgi:hypothetical protein